MRIRAGDTRIVRRFLWLPLVLMDEMMWWEWAFIFQEAMVVERPSDRLAESDPVYDMRWIDRVFLEKSE